MSENFGLSTIGQIALPVRDVDRAADFYQNTLGMKFLFKAPPGLAFFDCNGVRLLLDGAAENPEKRYSSVIYFMVPDLYAAERTLIERGVTMEQETHLVATLSDHELWMAFFRDLDENLLAMMIEVPLQT
jgi:methylmalonyl-CoA/ethylmalonyl-CoA epimerase